VRAVPARASHAPRALTPRPRPHPNRSVVAAITAQVQNGIHLQQNCMISEPVLELIEELKLIAPPGLSRFFFNCALALACAHASSHAHFCPPCTPADKAPTLLHPLFQARARRRSSRL
jgi:hypothetical protein